jgi:hypothetical protein
MKKLKARWGIKSDWQLVVVFVVFAINGSVAGRLGTLAMEGLGWSRNDYAPLPVQIGYWVSWSLLILPFYPILLMITGWLFGQSAFFWPFARRILNRISFGLLFKRG